MPANDYQSSSGPLHHYEKKVGQLEALECIYKRFSEEIKPGKALANLEVGFVPPETLPPSLFSGGQLCTSDQEKGTRLNGCLLTSPEHGYETLAPWGAASVMITKPLIRVGIEPQKRSSNYQLRSRRSWEVVKREIQATS